MANAIHTSGAGSSTTQTQAGDTVVLKATSAPALVPPLIGTVERTHHEIDTHQDPLNDALIFSHVPLPENVLPTFLQTGAPPKGYILVDFADETYGSALVAEDDVVLLSRSFNVGDTVKRHANDAMVGTVTSVADSYILQRICQYRTKAGLQKVSKEVMGRVGENCPLLNISRGFESIDFTLTDIVDCTESCTHDLPSGLSHPAPHQLLYNVLGHELKRDYDFREGDHVLYHDWLGVIGVVETDVFLLLADYSIVIVHSSWELHVVIPDLAYSPVTIPELEDDARRPEIDLVQQNGIDTMRPEQFCRGQSVVTNHRNLRNGTWLSGRYDPMLVPKGRVIDVRTRRIEVQWLCPNAFTAHNPDQPLAPPQVSLRPYENLSSFREVKEIRRNKELVLYDHDREPETDTVSVSLAVATGTCFNVGDNVKFVDTAAALRKYSGTNESGHGRFQRIPRDETFGFDMNDLRVIGTSQAVQVQWQDGSKSHETSTGFRAVILPEQDHVPGDLVAAKEGMKQIRLEDGQTSDFNEMSFFEHKHDLCPEKMGIIQSVNSQERIAQVRWFKGPRIELLEAATVLSAESILGPIGDGVEDVSLYEISTFVALECRRGDLVMLVPSIIARDALPNLSRLRPTTNPRRWGPALLSQLHGQSNEGLVSYFNNLAHTRFRDIISLFWSRFGELPESSSSSLPQDWVGEVVDIGLDGLLTVRLGALEQCRDVRISRDQILITVDESAEYIDEDGDFMNVAGPSWPGSDMEDEYEDGTRSPSPIDEEIEYEGGRRLDDDSSDDGWLTDEASPETKEEPEDVTMSDRAGPDDPIDTRTSIPVLKEATSPPLRPARQLSRDPDQYATILRSCLPASAPPSFSVLDTPPPPNQFRSIDSATLQPYHLKRLKREHRILASSLPNHSIFVRTYESRLDLLRCLIIGPTDTPYEHAPFLIDLHLGPNFPREPPTAHFHSWTSGLGRINPNLYEEGKICLSLLGTWPGKNTGEGWNGDATILQLLVSLQGLVFVKQPFYNEAGFEMYTEGEKRYTLESQQYSEKAYVMARGFVKHALLTPIQGLEDVVAWLYTPLASTMAIESQEVILAGQDEQRHRDLLSKTVNRAKQLIISSQTLKAQDDQGLQDQTILVDGCGNARDPANGFLRPLSQGAIVQLKRTIAELESIRDVLNNHGAAEATKAAQ